MAKRLQFVGNSSAVASVLDRCLTQRGERIADLSIASPVLVVFLRHAGCISCREALWDLSRMRTAIEQRGTRIVLVHMGDGKRVERAIDKYKLSLIDRISDSTQELYRAFGLELGRILQLLGPKLLWRTFAGVARYGIGLVSADPSQMPGVFLIEQSTIIRRFRHRTAADRPDYLALCE